MNFPHISNFYKIGIGTGSNSTAIEYVKDEMIIQYKQKIIDQPDQYRNLSPQIHAEIDSPTILYFGVIA